MEIKGPLTPRLVPSYKIRPENIDNNGASHSCNATPMRKLRDPIDSSPFAKPEAQSDKSNKINVYLRIRPLLSGETPINIHISDNAITIRPNEATNSSYFCVDKSFTFKEIFDSTCSQERVFTAVAHPILQEFIAGHDVFLFCYGSTNAGKTYTTSGTDANPGILPRSLMWIIPQVLSGSGEGAQLTASYMEIYNERVFDLLSTAQTRESLTVGINSCGDTDVRNVTEVKIDSTETAQSMVKKGQAARKRGFTEFNAESSRSHTVFRMKLTTPRGYSWLSIVDLAGSERLSAITSSKPSFTEACNINKSMLVLGRCIRKLKERSPSEDIKGQIPYRESKLTHLFQNLFEPSNRTAKAAIIINVSPSILQIEDTIFSLQFAADASQCKIRQIRSPIRVFDQEKGDDVQCVKDDEHRKANPIRELERAIRIEVKRQMEEMLIQRRLQFEHQLDSLRKAMQIDEDANGKGECDEISSMKVELSDLEKETRRASSESVGVVKDTQTLVKELKACQEVRDQWESKAKELRKLAEELEAMSSSLDTTVASPAAGLTSSSNVTPKQEEVSHFALIDLNESPERFRIPSAIQCPLQSQRMPA